MLKISLGQIRTSSIARTRGKNKLMDEDFSARLCQEPNKCKYIHFYYPYQEAISFIHHWKI